MPEYLPGQQLNSVAQSAVRKQTENPRADRTRYTQTRTYRGKDGKTYVEEADGTLTAVAGGTTAGPAPSGSTAMANSALDAAGSVAATLSAHTGDTDNPHATTAEQVGLGNVTNDAQVKRTEMGSANGVSTLDANKLIPLAQIPAILAGISADKVDGLDASAFALAPVIPAKASTAPPSAYPTGLSVFAIGADGLGWPSNYGTVLTLRTSSSRTVQLNIEKYSTTSPCISLRGVSASGDDIWSAWSTIWTSANDGAGSGLDADTVDGKQASDFAPSGYGLGAGAVSITGDINSVTNSGFFYADTGATNKPITGNGWLLVEGLGANYTKQTFFSYNATDYYIRAKAAGSWGAWKKIWHEGNDGSGSGLDADTVDGKHASDFAPSGYGLGTNAISTSNDLNTITVTGFYYAGTSAPNKPVSTNGWLLVEGYSSTYTKQTYCSYTNEYYVRTQNYGVWSAWQKIWHEGNDGAGSGLDADTVDGVHASDFSPALSIPAKPVTDLPASYPVGISLFSVNDTSWPVSSGAATVLTIRTASARNSQIVIDKYGVSNYIRGVTVDGAGWGSWCKIWTDANDGAGSGLDADTVDGQHLGTTADATFNSLTTSTQLFSTSAELTTSITFAGAANEKVDISVPSNMVYGAAEVSITSSWGGRLSPGLLTRHWSLYLNSTGVSSDNTGYYSVADSKISGQFAISDWKWDAANSRWYFTIANLIAQANTISVKLTLWSNNTTIIARMKSPLIVGAVYTTDTTIFPTPAAATTASIIGVTDGRANTTDLAPSGYARQAQFEMRKAADIGLSTLTTSYWVGLQTFAPWNGSGAGNGYQVAYTPEGLCMRTATLDATTWGGWQKIWWAGNDGVGSGLDADTVDGQHLSTTDKPQFGGLALGTTHVSRTYMVWFNSSVANQKADVYFPRLNLGGIRVTVYGAWNDTNASGYFEKIWTGGWSSTGTAAGILSQGIVGWGGLLTRCTISDPHWDATNNRWAMTVANLTSSIFRVVVKIEITDTSGADVSTMIPSLGCSAVYTTDTTVYPAFSSTLNADAVDGYHASNASGAIPISNGTVNVNLNADTCDGQHLSTTSTPTFGSVNIKNATDSNTTGAILSTYFSRGTISAPTAVQAGDVIINIGGRGHDGTNYSPYGTVAIQGTAEESFTPTSQATGLGFYTTPTGSTSRVNRVKITAAGELQALSGLKVTGNIGFFGTTPVAKAAALTAANTSTVDASYGQDEADVINNLRTRLNELESRLKAYGLVS